MQVKQLLFVLLIVSAAAVNAQPLQVNSPDGKVKLLFELRQGKPYYSVLFNAAPVTLPSKMGLAIKGKPVLGENMQVESIDSSSADDSWQPVWGELKSIRNNYRELVVRLAETVADKRKLNLVFRVFNDGVGFRYDIPAQPNLQHFIVTDELTSFALAGNHKAFWIPGDFETNEYRYYTSSLREINAFAGKEVNEISTRILYDSNAVQTPLMMKSQDGIYINIHEAALVNYPAMQLVLDKENLVFHAQLVPDAVGNKAYLKTPFKTPWRTIIVSDKAPDILASKLILNLNEPSAIQNTSFIKPMKFVGVWWEMHAGLSTWDYSGTRDAASNAGVAATGKHGATTANTKRYIDFAAVNAIQGILVEGWNTGWEDWFGNWKEDVFDFITPYPDFNVKELQDYATSKGVKLIMHHETSGAATSYDRLLDTAFRFMKQFGYPAVKTGYVGFPVPRGEHHDGQWMVNHYNRVLATAARYGIMVDAHEPVRPTGLHRTWPNFLAAEAARGNEFNAWSSGNPPEHETILPFTRLMGGPMDYTPGIFRIKMNHYNPNKTEQVHTTLAKQLALYVTMYSPLQMAADLPQNYEAKKDAFQFIKDVATDWDDTRILEAEPGDYITIARKAKGSEDWFIGAITDENKRQAIIPFGFLQKGRSYKITIYKDAPDAHWQSNPEAYTIENKVITSGQVLKVDLAPGGGCAITVKPLVSPAGKKMIMK